MNSKLKVHLLSVSVNMVLVCFLLGCSHKTDATSELEKAAKSLQQADPQTTTTPVTTAAATPTPTAPTQSVAPAQQMNQAIAAYKGGNLQEAVKGLQTLRAQTTMSAQQMMALQDATAAVMSDIYTRAAKGDPAARQAVKQYEAMQNAPRR